MKIVNSQGETVASYAYDVSGKLLYIKNYYNAPVTEPNHIGMLNPLRYRGYVYDDETGLYYLQSRYYDPVTIRFINADVYCDTNSGSPLSTNMYAYCENNAVHKQDANGKDAWWIQARYSAFVFFANNRGFAGHTSILLEEKPNYWWYFYWGPNSIQMLFVGGVGKKTINKYINNIIGASNLLYGELDIQNTDKYTEGIKFKGDFWASVNEILYFFKMSSRHSTSKIYRIRFNPAITDNDYKKLNSRNIKKVLKQSFHYNYLCGVRPESLIIKNNNNYDLISENCFHKSVFYLSYGKLYNTKHRKMFVDIMDEFYDAYYTFPNDMFDAVRRFDFSYYFKI